MTNKQIVKNKYRKCFVDSKIIRASFYVYIRSGEGGYGTRISDYFPKEKQRLAWADAAKKIEK
jgi:Uri superfamily endonuclease